jgi:hypothetical protein
MRGAPWLAVLLAAACGSTRPIEVPPPFDEGGILVTVKPRAYIDWPLGFESIRGTVENRTGRDVDLWLFLNLVDEKGRIVGHAIVMEDDFRQGAKRRFEALPMAGPPGGLHFFEKPPSYTGVTRGCAGDSRGLERLAACLTVLASWTSTLLPPQALDPAPVR